MGDRNGQDANTGNSRDNMDNDNDENDDMMLIDSDEENDDDGVPAVFHLASDRVVPFGAISGMVGPHRVNSQNRVPLIQFPQFLFGGNRDGGRFDWNLRVMAATHLENRGHTDLESGGKVILPQRALEELSRDSSVLMRPMMFKVTNQINRNSTHCGVLEFIAEEGTCYMPTWMMNILGVDDRDIVNFDRVQLPTATFAKFQPQSVDFLEISNPKAMLENSLRRFACITRGDTLAVQYNSRTYKFCVQETLPTDAVSIIECDMNVDFDAPVGYQSPSVSNYASEESSDENADAGENASLFKGAGNRLNGKTIESTPDVVSSNSNQIGTSRKKKSAHRHKPNEDWKIGQLKFKRFHNQSASQVKSGPGDQGGGGGGGPPRQRVALFSGPGFSLKTNKRITSLE